MDPRRPDVLVVRGRAAHQWAQLAVGLVFAAISGGAVAQGSWVVGGLGLLVTLGWLVPLAVRRLVTGGPVLQLDPAGMQVDGVRVSWTGVVGARTRLVFRGTPGVEVQLDPAGWHELAAQVPAWRRRISRMRRHRSGGGSWTPSVFLGVPPETLAGWVAGAAQQHRWG
jgi:hypothetical protein